MKTKGDTHTHSKFSSDGSVEIDLMVQNARNAGASYLAITDHCDFDVIQEGNSIPIPWRPIDLDAYYADFLRVREKTKDLYLAFGIEAGYDGHANDKYTEIIERYPFDVVINSVHFVKGWDAYFPYFFDGKTKQEAYTMYLETVLESLDAPYPFNIVGHIGYCVRNAPYADNVMHYGENAELIDIILKKVIETGAALEINLHNAMTPNIEIITRYYELGGRKISYGSDAHRGDVFKDYDKTAKMLREMGFTHFSVFKKRVEEKIEI